MVDCIIVKKYPIVFSEFRGQKGLEKPKMASRCMQATEYIQGKYG